MVLPLQHEKLFAPFLSATGNTRSSAASFPNGLHITAELLSRTTGQNHNIVRNSGLAELMGVMLEYADTTFSLETQVLRAQLQDKVRK